MIGWLMVEEAKLISSIATVLATFHMSFLCALSLLVLITHSTVQHSMFKPPPISMLNAQCSMPSPLPSFASFSVLPSVSFTSSLHFLPSFPSASFLQCPSFSILNFLPLLPSFTSFSILSSASFLQYHSLPSCTSFLHFFQHPSFSILHFLPLLPSVSFLQCPSLPPTTDFLRFLQHPSFSVLHFLPSLPSVSFLQYPSFLPFLQHPSFSILPSFPSFAVSSTRPTTTRQHREVLAVKSGPAVSTTMEMVGHHDGTSGWASKVS